MYEFGSETWSTPGSLIAEMQSRSHHVERFHLSEAGISQFLSSDVIWDILLVMDWKGLNFTGLDKQYLPKGLWVASETADCPQNFDKHQVLADRYHTLLCPAYDSTEKFKALGYDCIWWTHFADTRTQYPVWFNINSDGLPPVRSTRGIGGSQFLDVLQNIMPKKFINKNGMSGNVYGNFLARGSITIQNSRHHELSRRIFEGMACGSMVLTDRLPEYTNIDSLFTEDEDIVYYDGPSECISKINYYLRNDDDRKRIAENGYRKVLADHTQVQRVDTIISKYKEFLNNKI